MAAIIPVDLDILWDKHTKRGFAVSAFFLLLAVLIGLGEYFHWWNEWGEVALTIVAVVGLLLVWLTYVNGADRRQVAAVASAVDRTNSVLGGMDGKLDKLGTMDRKLDKLDLIQGQLDVQTGALNEQTLVLREIRDRL